MKLNFMKLNRCQIGVLLMCIILATILIVGAGYCYEKHSINQLSDKMLYTELVNIKGIGPVLAKRIVSYRADNKPISIADLSEIKGIGDKRLLLIKKKFRE